MQLRHFQAVSPLAALIHNGGQISLLTVVTVEARSLDSGLVEYHPVVTADTGELVSLLDWQRNDPTLRYRLDLSARLASEERRNKLEPQLKMEAQP